MCQQYTYYGPPSQEVPGKCILLNDKGQEGYDNMEVWKNKERSRMIEKGVPG